MRKHNTIKIKRRKKKRTNNKANRERTTNEQHKQRTQPQRQHETNKQIK